MNRLGKDAFHTHIRKIHKSYTKLSVISFLLFFTVTQSGQTNSERFSKLLELERVPGEVVVKLQNPLRNSKQILSSMGVSIASAKPFETNELFYIVQLANDKDMATYLERVQQNADIAYAEPNYIYYIDEANDPLEITPNDPQFEKLWGLNNSAQPDSENHLGITGADISAKKAWGIEQGSRDIIVAVIDTGVDYNHPDLTKNIYRNPGESGNGKENNGIDDDGNGFVDDYVGWNFAGVSNNNPMDDHYHGTHCSGTIGASGNDGIGIAGVAWNVRILPIKFLTSAGSGALSDAVKSIQYATKMHANIMSNSWGGGPFSQALYDSINEAKSAGILFVAAAGNDSENGDSIPHYPASYEIDNILTVAATDNKDQLASFSNWGKRSVAIAAPGVNIFSTLPKNRYGVLSGTSMATPHVSGAAALVASHFPNLNYLEVKDRLVRSRDPKANLIRYVASSGRLNAYNALAGIFTPSEEPQESEWIDGGPISGIESAHPYKENTNQTWKFRAPQNAKYIRLKFTRYDMEPKFDYVKIFDSAGIEIDLISGKKDTAGYSWYTKGNEVQIKFVSDSSVNGWGFAIEGYQYIPANPQR